MEDINYYLFITAVSSFKVIIIDFYLKAKRVLLPIPAQDALIV